MIDIYLAELVKSRQAALTIFPGMGKQLNVITIKVQTLLLGHIGPGAGLGKDVGILKNTAANHDAVQVILASQLQSVLPVQDVAITND